MKQTEVSELAEEFPVVVKITLLDAERIETVLMLLALQALLYFNPKVLVFFLQMARLGLRPPTLSTLYE